RSSRRQQTTAEERVKKAARRVVSTVTDAVESALAPIERAIAGEATESPEQQEPVIEVERIVEAREEEWGTAVEPDVEPQGSGVASGVEESPPYDADESGVGRPVQ